MKNKIILLITSITIFNNRFNAQCAMCKAVVETNLETGDKKGMGLNMGYCT